MIVSGDVHLTTGTANKALEEIGYGTPEGYGCGKCIKGFTVSVLTNVACYSLLHLGLLPSVTDLTKIWLL